MSQSNLPKEVPAIPYDAIITLEISGGFYSRMYQLLMYLRKEKSNEDFIKVIQELKTKKETNDKYSYQIETVLTFLTSLEKAADAQGKIKQIPIPPQQ